MNKIYFKLIAMSLALILSVTVVLMSTYAWLVLSSSPAVTGIHVAIGGGNTILTAPNIRQESDGKVYNYPGRFSDRLNFGVESDYEYLQQVGSLVPVSTTNGVEWFLPVYYSGTDKEVQEGWVSSGTLKDISEFRMDDELEHANLSPTKDQEKIREGSYVYLDFWVVAPGGDFTLRVSTDAEDPESTAVNNSGGSFVIDLMEPVLTDGVYGLAKPKSSGAGAVRVGFLANNLTLVDETMNYYQQSDYRDERFIKLKGMYQEPDSGNPNLDGNRFTIYEPNCDFHPTDGELDGTYVETKPLTQVNGKIRAERASNLTAQKKSIWVPSHQSGITAIEQKFQAENIRQKWDEDDAAEEVMSQFYGQSLQGQISPYVNSGSFIGSTENLNARLAASNDGILRQDELMADSMNMTSDGTLMDGATEDVYIIKLERNVPQRIRMFIWLEGQDVDCIEQICSSSFAVNIELACGDE